MVNCGSAPPIVCGLPFTKRTLFPSAHRPSAAKVVSSELRPGGGDSGMSMAPPLLHFSRLFESAQDRDSRRAYLALAGLEHRVPMEKGLAEDMAHLPR